jgi:hypothetical protein
VVGTCKGGLASLNTSGILIEVTLQGGQAAMAAYLSHLAQAQTGLARRKMSNRGNSFSSWGLMQK